MRVRLLLLPAILAATFLALLPHALALDSPRPLSGRELQMLLLGNTLIGTDEDGPYWMYYPSADTLWGRSAGGDVDVGKWWIENDSYCRAWRRWFEGRTRCWQMMSEPGDVLLWYSLDGEREGRSLVRAGNAMGDLPQMDAAPSQLADAGTGLSSELEAVVARAAVPPEDQIGPRGLTSGDREGNGGEPNGRFRQSGKGNAPGPKPPFVSSEDVQESPEPAAAESSSSPGGIAGLAGTRLGGLLDRLGLRTGGFVSGASTGGSGGGGGSDSDGAGGSGGGERSR